jgi:hypothetical protein
MIGLFMAAAVTTGAADVDRLAWLAGTWTQSRGQAVVRETWLAPMDGAMGGVGQTTRPGRPTLIEHMKITTEPAGATFTAILPGQPPTPFVLLPGKDGEAVFENKAHDFPQRVFYRRCGDDLCAGIEGQVKGELKRQEWRYTKVR